MIVRRLLLSCLLFGGLLASAALPSAAQAQVATSYADIQSEGLIFGNVCELDTTPSDDNCPCKTVGKCSVVQLLQVVVNLSYFIFALSGTIALAVLMYGGILWMTSAGNADSVKKGRQAISGAFVGLAIIFGSYVLINLVIGILKNGAAPTGTIENTVGDGASTIITTE